MLDSLVEYLYELLAVIVRNICIQLSSVTHCWENSNDSVHSFLKMHASILMHEPKMGRLQSLTCSLIFFHIFAAQLPLLLVAVGSAA